MTQYINSQLVYSATVYADDIEALLGPARDGPLDRKLAVTTFPNLTGRGGKRMDTSLRDLADVIQATTGPNKKALPLLKQGTFAGPRSDASLRSVSGVEADYDGGEVSMSEASQRLQAAGVGGLLYATPSSLPDKPKWRFLAPLSEDLAPAKRAGLVAKLAGVLRVDLDPTSFTASQAFYYGGIGGTAPDVMLVDGRFLDRLPDLPEVWPVGRERDRQPSSGSKTGLAFDVFADATRAVENDHRFDAREDWLRFGVAIHHETDGSADGLALFDEWSRAHPSYDADATVAAWESIHRHGSTGATVLRFARKNGWTDPADDVLDRFDVLDTEIANQGADAEQVSFGFEPVAAWTGTPPAREWVIPDMIPHRNVTSLYGDGSTGKSLLALQLAAAITTADPWIGRTPTRHGKVLFLSAEDEQAELHRRVLDIAGTTAGLADLLARSVVGEDCVLARADPKTGKLKPTARMNALENDIAAHRPALVVLDTLYDLFDGNQNDPALARGFVNMLRGLAVRFDTAIVLLAHPSQSGMNDGTGQAGARAWNNAVRSRLYLERVKSEEGNEEDPDARVLRTVKTNYAQAGGEVPLRWVKGRFVAQDVFEDTDDGPNETRDQKAERVFLALLERHMSRGQFVSYHRSPTYAPSVFAKDAQREGIGKEAFAAAMDRLIDNGAIESAEKGSASRRRNFLRAVSHA